MLPVIAWTGWRAWQRRDANLAKLSYSFGFITSGFVFAFVASTRELFPAYIIASSLVLLLPFQFIGFFLMLDISTSLSIRYHSLAVPFRFLFAVFLFLGVVAYILRGLPDPVPIERTNFVMWALPPFVAGDLIFLSGAVLAYLLAAILWFFMSRELSDSHMRLRALMFSFAAATGAVAVAVFFLFPQLFQDADPLFFKVIGALIPLPAVAFYIGGILLRPAPKTDLAQHESRA